MPIIISKENSDGFIKLLRSNLKEQYTNRKRKVEDIIHVSDILFGYCLRKSYYSRIIGNHEFTDEDIDNFVRGEASEYVLVRLADIGVGQLELDFDDGLLVARPDLYSKDKKVIVEFKDTKSFERLTPIHSKFKDYLRQLLYYLTISEIETGILCIRYASNRKLQWIKRDDQGDYFFSPIVNHKTGENKLPELETWTIILEKDSSIRELLRQEIRTRALLLRKALDTKDDSELPKVVEEWKCIRCPFLENCIPKNRTLIDSKLDILENEIIVIPDIV